MPLIVSKYDVIFQYIRLSRVSKVTETDYANILQYMQDTVACMGRQFVVNNDESLLESSLNVKFSLLSREKDYYYLTYGRTEIIDEMSSHYSVYLINILERYIKTL